MEGHKPHGQTVRMLEQELRGLRGALLHATDGIKDSSHTGRDPIEAIKANLEETIEIRDRMEGKMVEWQKRIERLCDEKMELVRELNRCQAK